MTERAKERARGERDRRCTHCNTLQHTATHCKRDSRCNDLTPLVDAHTTPVTHTKHQRVSTCQDKSVGACSHQRFASPLDPTCICHDRCMCQSDTCICQYMHLSKMHRSITIHVHVTRVAQLPARLACACTTPRMCMQHASHVQSIPEISCIPNMRPVDTRNAIRIG